MPLFIVEMTQAFVVEADDIEAAEEAAEDDAENWFGMQGSISTGPQTRPCCTIEDVQRIGVDPSTFPFRSWQDRARPNRTCAELLETPHALPKETA